MKTYAFWNNKGGTGKTSLAFQALTRYAEQHPSEEILAADLCPQSNLSELLLGGLTGNGSNNLLSLHDGQIRKSVGGYFQTRLPRPYSAPNIEPDNYISHPHDFNSVIPENIELLAGDPLLELQSNAMATLANTQIPGTNTWLAVVDWLRDFLNSVEGRYNTVFIDANPSFAIYTQIALSTANLLVLPVMADDSSRRALQNVFSLIYGIALPSTIYTQFSFTTKLVEAHRALPKVHLIAKNRITQYMGSASAYYTVLRSIDSVVSDMMREMPDKFSFAVLGDGMVEVRDFQTTGVVAFAKGTPFFKLEPGYATILGKRILVREDYLTNCIKAVDTLTQKL
jgi:cellulose biosynthesis protein BcsQ